MEDQKILFIHIPKTAGQSVTRFLLENVGEKYNLKNKKFYLINNKKFKIPGPSHYHHLNVNEYKNLINISLEKYFKFTIFRNPYTRFVSSFYFNKLNHNCETYRDFVTFFEKSHIDKKTEIYRHFVPQTWYIDYNLNNIDKFFHQEKLYKLEDLFLEKFNFRIKLKKENISEKKEKNIDNYSKDFIKEFYKKDFELLGYDHEAP